jgi:hypothetical protein
MDRHHAVVGVVMWVRIPPLGLSLWRNNVYYLMNNIDQNQTHFPILIDRTDTPPDPKLVIEIGDEFMYVDGVAQLPISDHQFASCLVFDLYVKRLFGMGEHHARNSEVHPVGYAVDDDVFGETEKYQGPIEVLYRAGDGGGDGQDRVGEGV